MNSDKLSISVRIGSSCVMASSSCNCVSKVCYSAAELDWARLGWAGCRTLPSAIINSLVSLASCMKCALGDHQDKRGPEPRQPVPAHASASSLEASGALQDKKA